MYNGQLSTSRCVKIVIIFPQHFVDSIEINGSFSLFQKIGNIIRSDVSKVETQKRMYSAHAFFHENQKRSILRPEEYGDFTTAEHKILNEGRESRNNHRYAVVVQVLAIQWNPCQTKTSQETDKNLRKFLQPSQKPKVSHTSNL